MHKTILITGATDGIGFLTAQRLAASGHNVLIHGRNPEKLARAMEEIPNVVGSYLADLSDLDAVEKFAKVVHGDHERIDVLLNNAGVLKSPAKNTKQGLDIRISVNTIAPYILTKRLLPIIPTDGRVVNLSSAAQTPIEHDVLSGSRQTSEMDAYSQSKLGITLWTQELAKSHPDGPVFVSVNPGSLLATQMVREGFGIGGNDITIGVDILVDAATGARFADKSGQYFDNDAGRFAPPNMAANDPDQIALLMNALKAYD